MNEMMEFVSGVRTAGIVLARSLPGDVGVACMTAELAREIADKYNVTTFSLWCSLGKRFDNIVMLYEGETLNEDNDLEAAKATRNLASRLSGPDGKVYVVV